MTEEVKPLTHIEVYHWSHRKRGGKNMSVKTKAVDLHYNSRVQVVVDGSVIYDREVVGHEVPL